MRVAQNWFKRFQSGNFDDKDESHSGRPVTVFTLIRSKSSNSDRKHRNNITGTDKVHRQTHETRQISPTLAFLEEGEEGLDKDLRRRRKTETGYGIKWYFYDTKGCSMLKGMLPRFARRYYCYTQNTNTCPRGLPLCVSVLALKIKDFLNSAPVTGRPMLMLMVPDKGFLFPLSQESLQASPISHFASLQRR
ncbi:hypothetical protein EVAR_14956_1 [Eumeta japonica]|uniref:Mos1 transposase HTH domain-containing protein n=1 Tax=Eumeta variegata TaxID=151549 RepID=A0A4C1XNQ4_EUMVA|nr:hypothetical protein EVAR_14956_1 [Eumeta japonica]